MPYESNFVPAEILLEYKGYTVYYTYNHGEVDDPTNNFYSLQEDEHDQPEFDVRELYNYGVKPGDKEYRKPEFHTREYHRDVIREAIEHGHLDDHIRECDLPTLKEQEWTEDYRKLARWQLLELMESYDRYLIARDLVGTEVINIETYYKNFFREAKLK